MRVPVRWLAAGLVTSAVCIAIVAFRSEQRREEATYRLQQHQASLASYNFAYRAASAVYVSGDETIARFLPSGRVDGRALTLYWQRLDSAFACQCPAFPQPRFVAAISTSAKDRIHPDRPEFREVLRTLLMRSAVLGHPGQTPAVVLDSALGVALSVRPRGREGARAVITVFDAVSFSRLVFGATWRARPPALPPALTGYRTNDSAMVTRVTDRRGRIVFAADAGATVVAPFEPSWLGVDSFAIAHVGLRPPVVARIRAGLDGTSLVWPLSLTGAALLALLWAVLRADALSRMREHFAVAVSHELRTPVAQMMLYAELATHPGTSTAQQTSESIGVILREARYLGHIVRNMLQFASGRDSRPIVRRPFSLAHLAREVADAMESRLRDRDLHLEIDVDADTHALGDPDALMLGVSNLVDNALRYSPPGATVHITGRREGTLAVLRVHDTGPGIPEFARRRVWRAFERADHNNRHPTGTGVGLAVARQMVTRCGGTIEIERSSPAGTVMRVSLPFADLVVS